jgi:hypothetical protein
LFEELLIEFESSYLSSEECESRLIYRIKAHIHPVCILDVGEVGEEQK